MPRVSMAGFATCGHRLSVIAVYAALCAGCHSLRFPEGLKDDGWRQLPQTDSAVGGWRWSHAELDELATGPGGLARQWLALADRNPVVAANAAIVLARRGQQGARPHLIAAIRDPSLATRQRRVAIEALSRLRDTEVDLKELLKQYGTIGSPAYQGALHAELIRGLSGRVPPGDHALTAALESAQPEVRRATLAAMTHAKADELPGRVIDLCQDADPLVRQAAIELVSTSGHAQAAQVLAAATGDVDLQVRLAAVTAMGRLTDGHSAERLAELARHESELIRAAAAGALAARGDRRAIELAANDQAWRVRLRAAGALANLEDDKGRRLAERLVRDPSAEVKKAVLAAVSEWQAPLASPVLLTALEGSSAQIRRAALVQLRRAWPTMPPLAAPEPTPAELVHLRAAWKEEFGAAGALDPPVVSSADPAATAAVFDEISALADRDLIRARSAATRLAELSRERALGELAQQRLAIAMQRQTDGLVWISVLDATAARATDAAAELAVEASDNESDEVRRRALVYFAAHPRAEFVAAIVPRLSDELVACRVAACQALAACGSADVSAVLLPRIVDADMQVRVAAAAGLALHQNAEGVEALVRLAHERDPAIARQAVLAMGDLAATMRTADSIAATPASGVSEAERLVGELIDLLNRGQGLRGAVLEVLPKATGQRPPAVADGSPLSAPDQAAWWRDWWAGRAARQTGTEVPVNHPAPRGATD